MIRSGNVQVWLATMPVDMRKSFDGLAEHVRAFLGHDPLCGSMFVFRNRNAQRAKILWWDKEGWPFFTSGSNAGRFSSPPATGRRRRSPVPS